MKLFLNYIQLGEVNIISIHVNDRYHMNLVTLSAYGLVSGDIFPLTQQHILNIERYFFWYVFRLGQLNVIGQWNGQFVRHSFDVMVLW